MTAQMSHVSLNRKVQEMYAGMSPEKRASENEFAAKLRAQSQTIIDGPKLDRHGNVWIPSFCWEPAAVAEWKRRGGQFRKLGRLYDAWKFRKGTITLEEAKALYVKFFGPVIDRERCLLNAASQQIETRSQK